MQILDLINHKLDANLEIFLNMLCMLENIYKLILYFHLICILQSI